MPGQFLTTAEWEKLNCFPKRDSLREPACPHIFMLSWIKSTCIFPPRVIYSPFMDRS